MPTTPFLRLVVGATFSHRRHASTRATRGPRRRQQLTPMHSPVDGHIFAGKHKQTRVDPSPSSAVLFQATSATRRMGRRLANGWLASLWRLDDSNSACHSITSFRLTASYRMLRLFELSDSVCICEPRRATFVAPRLTAACTDAPTIVALRRTAILPVAGDSQAYSVAADDLTGHLVCNVSPVWRATLIRHLSSAMGAILLSCAHSRRDLCTASATHLHTWRRGGRYTVANTRALRVCRRHAALTYMGFRATLACNCITVYSPTQTCLAC